VLGARVPPHDAYWGQYLFEGWHLNVHGPGFDGLRAQTPVAPGNSDLCFAWPGPIDDAVEHLRAHGVEVERGPLENARDGRMHVYFRDPDGSLLEFVSYVD
jgi:catechol 2,3-dioxygenase-like lactoylglutathione lyase family enzyme